MNRVRAHRLAPASARRQSAVADRKAQSLRTRVEAEQGGRRLQRAQRRPHPPPARRPVSQAIHDPHDPQAHLVSATFRLPHRDGRRRASSSTRSSPATRPFRDEHARRSDRRGADPYRAHPRPWRPCRRHASPSPGETGATIIANDRARSQWLADEGRWRTCDPGNTGGTLHQDGFARHLRATAFHSSASIDENGVSSRRSAMPNGLVLHFPGRTDALPHGRHRHLRRHGADRTSCTRPKIGLVPVGDRFTMGGAVAALACRRYFAFETIVPCHYGTFRFIDQERQTQVPGGDGRQRLRSRCASRKVGETLVLVVRRLRIAGPERPPEPNPCPSTLATVKRVAALCRASPSPRNAPRQMRGELNAILGFVEQLAEVDVAGVEPMTVRRPHADEDAARTVVTDGAQAPTTSSPTRRSRTIISSSFPRWWSELDLRARPSHQRFRSPKRRPLP